LYGYEISSLNAREDHISRIFKIIPWIPIFEPKMEKTKEATEKHRAKKRLQFTAHLIILKAVE
jgi:hypothetical protein